MHMPADPLASHFWPGPVDVARRVDLSVCETFEEVAKTCMRDVAPQPSISTVRQRHSHLNAHLLPRFGSMALMGIDIPTLPAIRYRTLRSASGKSVLNLLGTLNAVLAYAKKCGICVPDVPTSSLTLSGDRDGEVCRQNAVNASFGLLVLCVWVSLKWRGPTGIVYSSRNCGNHKLKAMISCGVGLLGTVGTASR